MEYDWLKPEIAKERLIETSLFLMSFHLLKSSIIEGVRDFFIVGFNEDKYTISEDYEESVLSKSKHKFDASLLWLKSVDAIDDNDIKEIQNLREIRNQLAHDIPQIVFNDSEAFDKSLIEKVRYYLRKIDNFWGQIDVDINADIDHSKVDYDNIVSIRSLILDYISQIVQK
ncbi:hypothetical protein ACFL5P_00440 [candidate division KSB1 bacterium]